MTEWTLETLCVHLTARLDEMDKRILSAISAQKEAVVKAEAATERRFEGVNEFRQTLTDQTRTFIPRTEAEQRFVSIEKSMESFISANTERRGKEQGTATLWGYLIGAVGIILAAVSYFNKLNRP